MPDSYWVDPDVEMQVLAQARQRRTRYAAMVGQFTGEQADYASSLLRRHPNLSAGLLQALAQAPQPQEIEERLAEEDDGSWFDKVRDGAGDLVGDVVGAVTDVAHAGVEQLYERGIKPVIRGTFTLADGLAQELVQRPLTSVLAAAQGEASVQEAYRDYGDSALRNLLTGDLDNDAEGGVLGTGFFAGGRAQAEADAERVLLINGRRADVGQAFAGATVGQFVDPGSRLYDAVAGISGFAVDVGLDPLAWMTGGSATAARLATKAGMSAGTVSALRGGATGALRSARTLRAGDAAELIRTTGAREILDAAGAIEGARRNTVLVEKASDFFRDSRLLSALAKADAYDIHRSWRNSMANRIDGDMIRSLGNAKTEEEVAAHLLDAVAHGDIREAALIRGKGHFVKSNVLTSRGPLKFLGPDGKLSGLAPRGVISAGSADEIWESAEKVDSLLRQANMGDDVRRSVFNRLIELEDGDYAGLMDVTTDALNEVAASIATKTGDVKAAKEMTSLKGLARTYSDDMDTWRRYGIDSMGNPIDVPYAKREIVTDFQGETIQTITATPQMIAELNSLSMTLPDIQDIRRASTKLGLLRSVYTSKGWELTSDATRSVTQSLFKPLAILRPAYIPRIGMEEQARLSAAGFDSVFNHPFRFIQANILNRKAAKDLVGDSLDDVARGMDVITRDAHGMLGDRLSSRARIFGDAQVKLDDAGNLTNDAYRGWRGELGQIAAGPDSRKMTELRGNLGEFKEWAQGEGLPFMRQLSRINDEARSLLDFGGDFDEWAAGLAKRVHDKTAGFDEDIVARVVDGSIPNVNAVGKQAQNADAAFHSFLSAKARQGINPAVVKVEHIEEARFKAMDTAVAWLFDHITGKPTSFLARYPAFRQSMVRRGEELMDALDSDDLRREVLEAFQKNMKLTDDEFTRLAQSAQNAAGKQGVIGSVTDFNDILVNRSAQDVKDLLFDVTKRGAGQEAMVVVLPFLDAWKEVTKTWAHLLKQNPAFFIRAQAGYRELKESGTFYVDEFGQEVFRYPGGGFLSTFVDEMNQRGGGLVNAPMAALESVGRVATGDTPNFSVAPQGTVQGVNMVANGVGPGFGPVIQWAASAFDTPDTQRLREFIAPFGTGAVDDPEDMLNFGGLVGSLAPAWLRKVGNAVSEGGVDERQWNSMVGDAMRALVASGEYDPSRDADRLLKDAKRYAEYQLLFRAGTQFAAPTGAQMANQVDVEADTKHPDWDPENDPSGRMFFLGVMREDYFRLTTMYGFDVGAEKFYEMYGIEPFYIAQGKTTSQGRELPVTDEGQRWMEANSDIADDLPLVAGFFAPTDEDAEFDFSAFSAQLLRGDRKSLKPEEQQALANKARARSIWARVKVQTEMLPAAMRESARAAARGQLEALHPGWQTDVIVQPAARDKISELARAAVDPRLDDNPLAQPLREYMALRERSLEMVRRRTGSPSATLGREDAALERRQLMTAGVRLAQQYPTFMGVWTGLLKNELMEG